MCHGPEVTCALVRVSILNTVGHAIYMAAWLAVILCAHFYPPCLCALPSSSCPFPAHLSILSPSSYFLPPFPISLSQHVERVGASILAVVVAGVALVTCDITVRDHMFEFGILDGICVGRVNEWCSLTWDNVAMNQMACRVSALGECHCVSCRVPFLAARHKRDVT